MTSAAATLLETEVFATSSSTDALGWISKIGNVASPAANDGEYDASGQRVRKFVTESGTVEKERVYLGSFEVYRQRMGGSLKEETTTLHISDDSGRMCMVERKTVKDGAPVELPTPKWRYQLSNHLGSSATEVTEDGDIISHEEYHPYGTSALRSTNGEVDVSAKRYRYTGQERDEETGLYYHGARYYAAWLGRWTAPDPIGLGDGVNRFAYVSGNPVGLRDSTGLAGETFEQGQIITQAQFDEINRGESYIAEGSVAVRLNAGEGYHYIVPTEALVFDRSVEGQDAQHLGYRWNGDTTTGEYWQTRYERADYVVQGWEDTKRAAARIFGVNRQIASTVALGGAAGVGMAVAAGLGGGIIVETLVGAAEGAFTAYVDARLDQQSEEVASAEAVEGAQAEATISMGTGLAGRVLGVIMSHLPRGARDTIIDEATEQTARKSTTADSPHAGFTGPRDSGASVAGKAAEGGAASSVKWKGFSKGSEARHFEKHGPEFGDVTQAQYKKLAKEFAGEAGEFQEQVVGNFIVKFDPSTRRTLVGHAKTREIRTFYKADERTADPFAAAVELARQLGGG